MGRISILVTVWCAMLATGVVAMTRYGQSPAATAAPPHKWPTEVNISREAGRSTLLMFVHPRCPCTRASLGELGRLLARCKNQPATYVVFVNPAETPRDWEQTELWLAATSTPGVEAVKDDGGVIAERFSASCSGETLLYDAFGELMFHGGVTASRGHYGDSAGGDAIVALINQETGTLSSSFVFGCRLCGDRAEGSEP